MGSGHFPLTGESAEKLRDAARAIETIEEKFYGISCEQDQVDNATSDGGYCHRLSLAVSLIRECVGKR